MIRRDIRLADGQPAWLLISQVEHARISEHLAERCVAPIAGEGELDATLRPVVLKAVKHHDDGWAEWERRPRLDREGRPVSFLEIEPAEAAAIWTRSIEAAADFGPLAGWMVAGHFLRLLGLGNALRDSAEAVEWRDGMELRRAEWLAEWQSAGGPEHTVAAAESAQQWLWTFDRASLWLCCDAPLDDEKAGRDSDFSTAGDGSVLEMSFLSGEAESADATGASPAARVVSATPWRFDREAIDVSATAVVVPAKRYIDADQLLAAARPRTAEWRLQRHLS